MIPGRPQPYHLAVVRTDGPDFHDVIEAKSGLADELGIGAGGDSFLPRFQPPRQQQHIPVGQLAEIVVQPQPVVFPKDVALRVNFPYAPVAGSDVSQQIPRSPAAWRGR